MAIIRQYHKDTDTTYVYESEYYYDRDKKQSRSRRRLIGKVDEETGQVVPTGARGRRKAAAPLPAQEGEDSLRARVEELGRENALLKARLGSLEERHGRLLEERDGAVRALRARVRELEAAIGRAAPAIERAAEGLRGAMPAPGEGGAPCHHQDGGTP